MRRRRSACGFRPAIPAWSCAARRGTEAAVAWSCARRAVTLSHSNTRRRCAENEASRPEETTMLQAKFFSPRRRKALFAGAAVVAAPGLALAQAGGGKPVSIVVSYPPGGG